MQAAGNRKNTSYTHGQTTLAGVQFHGLRMCRIRRLLSARRQQNNALPSLQRRLEWRRSRCQRPLPLFRVAPGQPSEAHLSTRQPAQSCRQLSTRTPRPPTQRGAKVHTALCATTTKSQPEASHAAHIVAYYFLRPQYCPCKTRKKCTCSYEAQRGRA